MFLELCKNLKIQISLERDYPQILERGIRSAKRSENKNLEMTYIEELLTFYPESYSIEDFK